MDQGGLVDRASAAPSLLVATDFDGTIAEITSAPDEATLGDPAIAALVELSRSPGVHVAVISGRTDADLATRTAALGRVWRVAEHGASIRGPDATGALLVESLARSSTLLDLVERSVAAIAERHPAVRVERKSTGVAVHWRQVPAHGRATALAEIEAWADEAGRLGLVVLQGRQVVEVRTAGQDKAHALTAILAAIARPTDVVYAGDDRTDECAIALATLRGGVGVYIASGERPWPTVPADLIVDGPARWIEILQRIALARGRSPAAPT